MPISDRIFEQTERQKRQKRQYIDAQAVFRALLATRKEAAEVRGSMFWRELRGVKTLIRTSAAGAQKSLGPETPETIRIYGAFMARKERAEARPKSLKEQYKLQQRLNRAQRNNWGQIPINAGAGQGVQLPPAGLSVSTT